jgi:hypothetical protein
MGTSCSGKAIYYTSIKTINEQKGIIFCTSETIKSCNDQIELQMIHIQQIFRSWISMDFGPTNALLEV